MKKNFTMTLDRIKTFPIVGKLPSCRKVALTRDYVTDRIRHVHFFFFYWVKRLSRRRNEKFEREISRDRDFLEKNRASWEVKKKKNWSIISTEISIDRRNSQNNNQSEISMIIYFTEIKKKKIHYNWNLYNRKIYSGKKKELLLIEKRPLNMILEKLQYKKKRGRRTEKIQKFQCQPQLFFLILSRSEFRVNFN